MAGSFSGGGCVSDAPPFARLALYMEKRGWFFWKMKKGLIDAMENGLVGDVEDGLAPAMT